MSPRAPRGEHKAPKRRRLNVTLGRCTKCKATTRFHVTYGVKNKARCLGCGSTKAYRAPPAERRTLIHLAHVDKGTACGVSHLNVAVAAKKSLVTCERCRKD
jgi:hypothetical protein